MTVLPVLGVLKGKGRKGGGGRSIGGEGEWKGRGRRGALGGGGKRVGTLILFKKF